MELRRSKRRSCQPDRYGHSEKELDSKDGWVKLMPYKYSTRAVSSDEYDDDDEVEDGKDSDDDLYRPVSRLSGIKGSKFIPFTPLYEPIPLENFGPDGNSIFGGGGGGFSDSHLMDEIDKYRSKAAKNGKKNFRNRRDGV
ncbi:unnamed protein product [Cochlearia groenlandica]